MFRKTVLLFLLVALNRSTANAQEKITISRGLYFGGEFYTKANTYGYYWLGKDSAFVMVSFKEDSSVLYLGAGNYYIKGKDTLVREFRQLPALYYNKNTVQYTASTQGSPDSLYFSGTITDEALHPFKVASLNLPGLPAISKYPGIKPNPALPPVYKGVTTDTNGHFHIVLPASYNPTLLRFSSPFACPLDLPVLKNFNMHTINVSLNQDCTIHNNVPPGAFSFVEPVKLRWPLKKSPNPAVLLASADSKFTKLANTPAVLMKYIQAAKRKQPNLKLQLEWMEGKVKE